MNKNSIRFCLISLLVFLSYSNSLTLDYALDDRLVIFENDYTLKGYDGVRDLFTKDSFSGYFGHSKNLVAGGRYRPIAQLTFIIEYELFGGNLKEKVGFNRDPKNEKLFEDSILPFIGHLNNILLYLFLCFVVFKSLKLLFPDEKSKEWYSSIPFMATLLFALHPIHTEAVTNIKGRDEILSMLGSMSALYFSLRYVNTRKLKYLLFSFITFLLGLFSKENAITFLAIVPLSIFYLQDKKSWKDYLFPMLPLLIGSIIFLIVRTQVLGSLMASETEMNILNNPFIGSTFWEKIATVLITWGLYLKLMVFPHPLTHDYYPYQIEITNFSNPMVWLILVFVGWIIYYSIIKIRSRNIAAYAILFFIITFSITSNLFYSVGTLMNERFVFASLLGFSIISASVLQWVIKKTLNIKNKQKISILVLFPILLFYMGKTFSRNFAWHNDISLFTNDVKVSSNSIKCNVSAGGSYIKLYHITKKERNLILSKKYLDKAMKLDPSSYNGLLLMAEYHFLKKDYATSYQIYSELANNNPNDQIAVQNSSIALQRWKGSQIEKVSELIESKEIKQAFELINQFLTENPENPDAISIKGKIFGQGLNQLDSARFYFKKALIINPNHVSSLENMGVSYAIQGDLTKAMEFLSRAQDINPESESIRKNIELVRSNMKKNK
ncbi:MAG TPA: hypothetical protein PLI77_05645 [Bacteroidales bacterium]|nr:hypothetical protein [Bacteroidales bacterium]